MNSLYEFKAFGKNGKCIGKLKLGMTLNAVEKVVKNNYIQKDTNRFIKRIFLVGTALKFKEDILVEIEKWSFNEPVIFKDRRGQSLKSFVQDKSRAVDLSKCKIMDEVGDICDFEEEERKEILCHLNTISIAKENGLLFIWHEVENEPECKVYIGFEGKFETPISLNTTEDYGELYIIV